MTGREYSSSLSAGVSDLRVTHRCVLCMLGLMLAAAWPPDPAAAQDDNAATAAAQTTTTQANTVQGNDGDAGAFRIGVVDMRAAIQDNDAIAALRNAIDEKNKQVQNDISKEEEGLRKTERELEDQRSTLPADEFRKQSAALQNRVFALQRKLRTQQDIFERAYADAQEKIGRELILIISDIKDEMGFAVILDRKNTVLYDRGIDITGLVLERLNERTRNFKVTLEPKDVQ